MIFYGCKKSNLKRFFSGSQDITHGTERTVNQIRHKHTLSAITDRLRQAKIIKHSYPEASALELQLLRPSNTTNLQDMFMILHKSPGAALMRSASLTREEFMI